MNIALSNISNYWIEPKLRRVSCKYIGNYQNYPTPHDMILEGGHVQLNYTMGVVKGISVSKQTSDDILLRITYISGSGLLKCVVGDLLIVPKQYVAAVRYT